MSYTYYVKPEVRECFKNGTPDSEILERINYGIPNETAEVRRITKSLILIVSLLATIMTIIFIFAVIKAIKNHQVSRKCYVLVLTRSFGDLLASVSFLIFCILQFTMTNSMATQQTVFRILVLIMNAAIWSEMISYNLLSGIKLYCVVKPLHYRNNFTFKRCLYLSSLSWITFIIIFLMNFIRYIVCNHDNCGPLYDQIQSAIYTGVHCFTIIFFILTAIFVYRARKFPDGRSTKKSKFPFSTYVIMLGTFIFVYSFLIANDIFFSFIFPHLSYCFKTLKEPSINAIKGSIYILFFIRIFIDPIINCFIDKKIKASVASLLPSCKISIGSLQRHWKKLTSLVNDEKIQIIKKINLLFEKKQSSKL